MELEFYDRREFIDFIHSLPDKDQKKLILSLDILEQQPLAESLRTLLVKKIDNNLYELRVRFGHRRTRVIFFQLIQAQFVVTNAFTKKTPKTPRKELKKARQRKKIYLRRYSNGHRN